MLPRPQDVNHPDQTPVLTVAELVPRYLEHAAARYGKSEYGTIRDAVRLLLTQWAAIPISQYMPAFLLEYRKLAFAKWSRKHAMGQTKRITAMWKWAATRNLVPVDVHTRLTLLEQPSLSEGHDNPPIQSADPAIVEEVCRYLRPRIKMLVQLQLLTGARPGELLGLKPIDIDTRKEIWKVELKKHKNLHHNKKRTLYFGAQAQPILTEVMSGRPMDAYLWDARDSERWRSEGAARLSTNAYALAVRRACLHAYPLPADLDRIKVPMGAKKWRWEKKKEWEARMGEAGMEKVRAWRRDHHWTPYQLRHTVATVVDDKFGAEASQLLLGHSSAKVTTAIYIDRERKKLLEVVKAVG